eukprot:TRINITY_DN47328_c0_g1_i1.p1 TRINITY_DN47328_c0_g1~~TRINITY_DN47328_c0_g1_i1.p1  ORF type:complete len:400 (+),score=49.18 TRINITY_DN47328_c0_g1_i1:41-1240(+)
MVRSRVVSYVLSRFLAANEHRRLLCNFEVSRGFGSVTLRQQRHNLNLQLRPARDEKTDRAKSELPENAHHTKQIMALARERKWFDAKAAFDSIPQKNTIVYGAIITAASRCQRYSEGMKLFEELRSGPLECNSACYGSALVILSNQGRLEETRGLVAEMQALGMDVRSATVVTALLNASAVSGNVAATKEQLETFSREGVALNHTYYGCLIKACREAGDPAEAWQALKQARTSAEASIVHYTMVLGACSRAIVAGRMTTDDADDYVVRITQEMDEHGVERDSYFLEELVRVLLGGSDIRDVDSYSLTEERAKKALAALDSGVAAGLRLTRLLGNLYANLKGMTASRPASEGSALPPLRSASAGSALPAGWCTAVDPTSGASYYWKSADPAGTSTWQRPS